MGIFDRLRRLIKANVNSALDKAEDPEKILNQAIQDMNQQLIEVKKGVAAAIADEKRLERMIQENRTGSAEWEKRAVLAIREAEKDPTKQAYYEDLARQALLRKKEHDDNLVRWQEEHGIQHKQVENLKQSLRDLSLKIDEAQRRRTLLVARAKRAETRKMIQEQMSGLNDNSAFEAFERMAQKVDRIEVESEALAELEDVKGTNLEAEFAKLEAGSKGDDLLEQFKRKMASEKIQAPKPEPAKAAASHTASSNQKAIASNVGSEVDLMMDQLKKKLHS